jgi:hypothetical protein
MTKKADGREPKWSSREDECLSEAWKTVSIDPFTGANQNSECYWKMVKAAFDERGLLDPHFNILRHDRNESGMSRCWAMIQHACNKWHDILHVHVSSTNFDDQISKLASILHCRPF